VVGGCIPAKFSGYRPAGAGALESVYCVGRIRDALRIEAPAGVSIFLRADSVTLLEGGTPGGREIGLEARVTVPDGVKVRLTSPILQVESPEWPGPRQLEVARILAPGPREYGATATLTGTSRDLGGWFSLEIGLPGIGTLSRSGIPAPKQFTLRMPAIEIGGEPFDVGPVRFDAYEEWGVYTCVQ
jgi:hypothetical protein